jgi:hypothetical protein
LHEVSLGLNMFSVPEGLGACCDPRHSQCPFPRFVLFDQHHGNVLQISDCAHIFELGLQQILLGVVLEINSENLLLFLDLAFNHVYGVNFDLV